MQFLNIDNRVDSISRVRIAHGDSHVDYPLNTYEKTNLRNPGLLFANVNNWLSLQSTDVQEGIFDVYKEIHEMLNEDIDYEDIIDMLIRAITNLYEIINPEDMSEWLRVNGRYVPPTDLHIDYHSTDIPKLTYLRHEYAGLMTLADIFRFMLPVWGGFLRQYASVIGTEWKELAAWNLIGGSVVPEIETMVRLDEYIHATLETMPINMASIFAGLGTVDAIKYQIARAVTRKVAIGETSDCNVSIIKNVSTYVRNNTKGPQLDRMFVGESRLADKRPPKDKEGGDKTSIVETYKTKQEYPDSVEIGMLQSLRRYHDIAAKVCPGIAKGLVNDCVRFTLRVKPEVIIARQQLAALATAKAIEPDVLLVTGNEGNWLAIGIAMAIYIHMGEPTVAALLTADLTPPKSSLLVNANLNSVIPKVDYMRLDALYYSDLAGAVTVAARRMNPGHMAITDILGDLGKYTIKVNMPDRVLRNLLSSPVANSLGEIVVTTAPKGGPLLEQGQVLPSHYKLGVSLVNLIVALT